ncbi:MAG: hypothetical protein V1783_11600 [Bacteroidota bacterium]
MIKKCLILIVSLISISGFSQGNRMNIEERYRSQKIAFITDKMQLSPSEAELFWPLYREMEEAKDKLAQEMRDFRSTFPKDEVEYTEEQASEFLNFMNKHSASMSKLILDYQKKFLKVISAKKLLLLHSAETGFRRHLLEEFRNNRNARPSK